MSTAPPRRAIRVGLGTENQMVAQLYEDFEAVDFGEYPSSKIPGNWWDGYESFLEPDSKRRDTFEIVLSADHIRVGMPDYDFWWIDADIPELDWTTGRGAVRSPLVQPDEGLQRRQQSAAAGR